MAKIFEGIVVSNKMQGTVVVKVERTFLHPIYKKVVKRHKKYLVDTNKLELIVGDKVKIKETRPLSAHKHFIVVEKLEK